jgi:hypothetical protein
VRLRFIEPGKPVQNAFVEGFHGRLRDECLDRHRFLGLGDARRTVEPGGRTTIGRGPTARSAIERPRSSGSVRGGADQAQESPGAHNRWTKQRGHVTTRTVLVEASVLKPVGERLDASVSVDSPGRLNTNRLPR